ncbi:MAG: hypothetical protein Tsb0014_00300 [Pleurocapsa sp.]
MTLSEYLKLFQDTDAKAIGEGSTQYLYSKIAAREIYEFNPNAKIIIMLRNPVEFLYSYHNQCLLTLAENIEDFELALNAESERKAGKNIPSECTGPANLFYTDVATFSEQIQRYFDVFGKERVLITIFDDFKINTSLVYQKTLDFLNVDSNFQADFKIYNSRQTIRNKTVYNAYMNFKWSVHKVGRLLKPMPFHNYTKKQILNIINNEYLNEKILRKPDKSYINPNLKKQLAIKFTPEIKRLSSIIDRDLSHWIPTN